MCDALSSHLGARQEGSQVRPAGFERTTSMAAPQLRSVAETQKQCDFSQLECWRTLGYKFLITGAFLGVGYIVLFM